MTFAGLLEAGWRGLEPPLPGGGQFRGPGRAGGGSYMAKLPTSFRLKPEEVDKLRDAARRLLRKSESFQKLLRDLEK
jgi:hypothetical protein